MQKKTKFLIIQTAFIGDVILATSIIENIHREFPNSEIHFCLRKGNESLFEKHPFLKKIIIWNKNKKYKSLFKTIKTIRQEKYNTVICVQRFFNAGLIAATSGAKNIIGFKKNPLSFLFSATINHQFNKNIHETERNNSLINNIVANTNSPLKLHINQIDNTKLEELISTPFICIAPASVWFTKQYPANQWVELINNITKYRIYIIGAPNDEKLASYLIENSLSKNIKSLCGKLSLLESAALMKYAQMNYVNDSAPMHLASAVNAKVCAIYCSTIPEFGFGPLSNDSFIIQSKENLKCRPCGLHGHNSCPKKHFNCAKTINTQQLLDVLN